jgi:hypothetical protein
MALPPLHNRCSWHLQVYYIAKKCNHRCTAEEYAIALARHFVDTYPKVWLFRHPAKVITSCTDLQASNRLENCTASFSLQLAQFEINLHIATSCCMGTNGKVLPGPGHFKSAAQRCPCMTWVVFACAGHKSKGYCGTGALAESNS